ncbi:MAG: XdhC family protein [Candidatus Heimdallarchaeota archaeon]|nr:XdhC family protein [Candidatus Heimdallarchaeota archaeon]
MNEEMNWKTVLTKLENDKKIVLVVIINQTGSAPNSPGAKMFVMPTDVIGTVGGGISEYNLLTRARKMLADGVDEVETEHMEHSETAEDSRSGMICSGAQTFALVPLQKKDITVVHDVIRAHEEVQPGKLTITKTGLSFDFGNILGEDNLYSEKEDIWSYQENIGVQERLFIIGGGHVSLALSKIMVTLGFHITVFDDRNDLPTMKNNIHAHSKEIIKYDQIANLIPEGKNIYVTIMTFGHASDELVLERLISRNYKYLGMMASISKAKQVLGNLENKGISRKMLDKVYSPIGMKIKSITPEEIAISIAAEIVLVKNAKN